jgi:putative glutamine amidotransferase
MGAGLSSWPLIGVTTSEIRAAERTEPSREGDPPQAEMALGMKYARAIELAGGVPVVIPPLGPEATDALMEGLSAVCISGGPDIDPVGYGQDPHPDLGPTEVDLDNFELTVARAADRRRMPILGICRGMQALNVARGGTLHQHLPGLPGPKLDHRQTVAGEEPTHAVDVEPESQVAALLGRESLRVNSFHHQAIDRLGTGLGAVAWAPDGVVEAVEAPFRSFVVGVQWHAECLTDMEEQLALFGGFVEAARRYGVAGRAVAA